MEKNVINSGAEDVLVSNSWRHMNIVEHTKILYKLELFYDRNKEVPLMGLVIAFTELWYRNRHNLRYKQVDDNLDKYHLSRK